MLRISEEMFAEKFQEYAVIESTNNRPRWGRHSAYEFDKFRTNL